MKRPTGLLRLIGEARVEQKDRQDAEVALSVSDEQAAHRRRKEQSRNRTRAQARKRARAVARSQRRGMFGLHQQIANAK